MAFGIKMKKIKFKNAYTIESLYEAIKDTQFAAGEVKLLKHGMATLIGFPPLDMNNQIQIIPASFKKESNAYRVMKAEPAGLDNFIFNAAVDGLTDGLSSMGTAFGKNAKTAEQLVDDTVATLESLNL